MPPKYLREMLLPAPPSTRSAKSIQALKRNLLMMSQIIILFVLQSTSSLKTAVIQFLRSQSCVSNSVLIQPGSILLLLCLCKLSFCENMNVKYLYNINFEYNLTAGKKLTEKTTITVEQLRHCQFHHITPTHPILPSENSDQSFQNWKRMMYLIKLPCKPVFPRRLACLNQSQRCKNGPLLHFCFTDLSKHFNKILTPAV